MCRPLELPHLEHGPLLVERSRQRPRRCGRTTNPNHLVAPPCHRRGGAEPFDESQTRKECAPHFVPTIRAATPSWRTSCPALSDTTAAFERPDRSVRGTPPRQSLEFGRPLRACRTTHRTLPTLPFPTALQRSPSQDPDESLVHEYSTIVNPYSSIAESRRVPVRSNPTARLFGRVTSCVHLLELHHGDSGVGHRRLEFLVTEHCSINVTQDVGSTLTKQ